MYYFRNAVVNGENFIEKYKVMPDLRLLGKIKKEIINSYSIITHNKTVTSTPEIYRNSKYRNVNLIQIKDESNNFTDKKKYYEIEYDEYEFPDIIRYIDLIIEGEYKYIEDLENPKLSQQLIDEELELDIKEKEIRKDLAYQLNKKSLEIENTHISFQELYTCVESKNKVVEKKDNFRKLVEKGYYKRCIECLNLSLISCIELKDFEMVMNFFDNDIEEIEKHKEKMLTKN